MTFPSAGGSIFHPRAVCVKGPTPDRLRLGFRRLTTIFLERHGLHRKRRGEGGRGARRAGARPRPVRLVGGFAERRRGGARPGQCPGADMDGGGPRGRHPHRPGAAEAAVTDEPAGDTTGAGRASERDPGRARRARAPAGRGAPPLPLGRGRRRPRARRDRDDQPRVPAALRRPRLRDDRGPGEQAPGELDHRVHVHPLRGHGLRGRQGLRRHLRGGHAQGARRGDRVGKEQAAAYARDRRGSGTGASRRPASRRRGRAQVRGHRRLRRHAG